MSRVALSLATALAVVLAAQATPAEAGKIGRAVAATATKAAVGAAIKSGKSGDKNDEETGAKRTSTDNQTVRGDVDARAAHAKAKLEEEKGPQGTVFAGATDLSPNANSGVICLAGCN